MKWKTWHWTDYEKDAIHHVRTETRRQSMPLTEFRWEHACLSMSGRLWSDPQMTTKVLLSIEFFRLQVKL